ncbi:LytTR family DNA-binding domain-containing protein [Galbibacter sp. EGI 63066]|uniref:LytR/AlgR family response regulator transcription factor n=1 Tax=Galbibacter sp. EGI 63066 TaxID=2993559 RepID=UPI002248A8E2|nr:LytTR family DNA-binding domain-containing protein [Galbibacter sp. EGI 63066]MCX2678442.1 LytTR family DNA-binding domain-containing protein [Galbibacter sp. EGI 63066]
MILTSIIIDDEKHSRETLKKLIFEFCEDIEVLATASNVKEAVATIKAHRPDLVFLDIELQTGTGFDVLEQLSDQHFEVIFTTAFEQYAIKALKMSSLDYLLKPIDIDELIEAVEKAKHIKNKTDYKKQLETLLQNLKVTQAKHKQQNICLSTTDGIEFLPVQNIAFCKSEGSYTQFILTDNTTILVSKHLKEYEKLLPYPPFMRVHNSYLINLSEVKKYIKTDGGYILMNGGQPVSLSRTKKDDFLKAMENVF